MIDGASTFLRGAHKRAPSTHWANLIFWIFKRKPLFSVAQSLCAIDSVNDKIIGAFARTNMCTKRAKCSQRATRSTQINTENDYYYNMFTKTCSHLLFNLLVAAGTSFVNKTHLTKMKMKTTMTTTMVRANIRYVWSHIRYEEIFTKRLNGKCAQVNDVHTIVFSVAREMCNRIFSERNMEMQ